MGTHLAARTACTRETACGKVETHHTTPIALRQIPRWTAQTTTHVEDVALVANASFPGQNIDGLNAPIVILVVRLQGVFCQRVK